MSRNRLHILSSGSKGNALLIENDNVFLLIDQGLSLRRFTISCAAAGIDPSRIIALFVTHEHTDHINGVPLTAHRLNLPVYAAPSVIEYLFALCNSERYRFDTREITSSRPITVYPFRVEPFPVVHDARDPYGFTVTLPNEERLTLVTDTGTITHRICSHMAISDYLVIEANHDPYLLYRNPHYPADLKQRIRSANGHLSNEQCIEALERVGKGRLKKVIFAHLSEENNSPELVRHAATVCFDRIAFAGESFVAPRQGILSIELS